MSKSSLSVAVIAALSLLVAVGCKQKELTFEEKDQFTKWASESTQALMLLQNPPDSRLFDGDTFGTWESNWETGHAVFLEAQAWVDERRPFDLDEAPDDDVLLAAKVVWERWRDVHLSYKMAVNEADGYKAGAYMDAGNREIGALVEVVDPLEKLMAKERAWRR